MRLQQTLAIHNLIRNLLLLIVNEEAVMKSDQKCEQKYNHKKITTKFIQPMEVY